jgi:hypothetical protein
MTKWGQEQAKDNKEPPKMSEEETKKFTQIGEDMGKCMQKAMGGGGDMAGSAAAGSAAAPAGSGDMAGSAAAGSAMAGSAEAGSAAAGSAAAGSGK